MEAVMMLTSPVRTTLAAGILATCLLAAAPAARAQSGSMMISMYNRGDDFIPSLSRRDLDVFTRVLRLRPDERRALDDLYDGHAAALTSKSAAVRRTVGRAIDRSEGMQDRTLLAPAEAELSLWREEAKTLQAAFLEDLKSLLTREQEERWPLLERELRRIRQVSAGRLSGESLDLVELVENLQPSARTIPSVAALTERYSEELDRVLTARAALLERASEFNALIVSDPSAAEALFDDAARARVAVRDLNLLYVRLIEAELPRDVALGFHDTVAKSAYRPASSPTRAEGYLVAALALGTLSPDQRAALESIRDADSPRRRAWFDRAATALREDEPGILPTTLAAALGRVTGAQAEAAIGNPDKAPRHPIRAPLLQDRYALDAALRDRVDAVLTPDQQAACETDKAGFVTFHYWEPWGL